MTDPPFIVEFRRRWDGIVVWHNDYHNLAYKVRVYNRSNSKYVEFEIDELDKPYMVNAYRNKVIYEFMHPRINK